MIFPQIRLFDVAVISFLVNDLTNFPKMKIYTSIRKLSLRKTASLINAKNGRIRQGLTRGRKFPVSYGLEALPENKP